MIELKAMNYKLYKTPDPHNRVDTSLPYNKNIAELLLNFDDSPNLKEGISKIVTVPSQNEIGFNVVACQAFFRGLGSAAYVFLHDQEGLYQFRQAILPVRNAGKRFVKAGLKGLLFGFGAEEIGIVEKKFDVRGREERDEYEQELLKLCLNNKPIDDWYHFTGTTQRLLAELQQKCTPLRR